MEAEDKDLDALFPSDPFTEVYAKYAKEIYTHDVIQVPDDIYIETLTTLDLFVDSFQGKTVELVGFIYRTEQMAQNQFVVGRFAVSCCSADASPYGIFSEFPKAAEYANDQWVKVTGTIGKINWNDAEIMKIDVSRIDKVEAPAEPYVYTNYDFGLEP